MDCCNAYFFITDTCNSSLASTSHVRGAASLSSQQELNLSVISEPRAPSDLLLLRSHTTKRQIQGGRSGRKAGKREAMMGPLPGNYPENSSISSAIRRKERRNYKHLKLSLYMKTPGRAIMLRFSCCAWSLHGFACDTEITL